MAFVFWSSLDHAAIKYRCPIKKSNRITSAHTLTYLATWISRPLLVFCLLRGLRRTSGDSCYSSYCFPSFNSQCFNTHLVGIESVLILFLLGDGLFSESSAEVVIAWLKINIFYRLKPATQMNLSPLQWLRRKEYWKLGPRELLSFDSTLYLQIN